LKVRPNLVDEYRNRHAQVWPSMTTALKAAGWRNYSLFLRQDGLLIGYLTCSDFEAARAAMKSLEVNTQWQAEMAPFFEALTANPDDEMQPLEEVFHLD
jgi:L-rhamnose mutarotase